MKISRYTLLLALVIGLSACGDAAQRVSIPVQHWKEMDVRIETHPNPPLAGMSEIVVIVTGLHGKPIQDMTVSLRGNDAMPWVQAIQDGYMGAYRRAIDIGSGDDALIQVRLQQGMEQKTLLFPLKLSAG
jgi:hypothetical protein